MPTCVLAIDTSTEACSAALSLDGSVISRFVLAPQEHSRLILPMLEELLAEAGVTRQAVDVLAYGRGPGSFTGIRIGTGIVQGLALGLDRPVVAVSTLYALAQGQYRRHAASKVLAGIDARMQEVYWAEYQVDEQGRMQLQGEEQVCAANEVPVPTEIGWTGAGTAWATYGETLEKRLGSSVAQRDPDALPEAQDLLDFARTEFELGRALPADRALPVYLRDKVAWQRS